MNQPRNILQSPITLLVASLLFLDAASITPFGLLIWAMVISGIFAYVFEGHHYQTAWLSIGVFLAIMIVLIPSGSTGEIKVKDQGLSVAGLTAAAFSGLLIGIYVSRWVNQSSTEK